MKTKNTQEASGIPLRVLDADLLRIHDPSWNELLWVDHRTELGRLGPGGELLGLDRFRELKGIMGREYFKLHDVEARLIKTTGKELGKLNWSAVMALLRSRADIEADSERIQIDPDAYEILGMICDSPTRLKVREIASAKLDRKTVAKHLKDLVDNGFVEYNPKRKTGASATEKGRNFIDSTT